MTSCLNNVVHDEVLVLFFLATFSLSFVLFVQVLHVSYMDRAKSGPQWFSSGPNIVTLKKNHKT